MIEVLCIAGMLLLGSNEPVAVNPDKIQNIRFDENTLVIRGSHPNNIVVTRQDRDFTMTDIQTLLIKIESCRKERQ